MANFKRPEKSIKGVVLLMVLTIMFVLIIMLIATLTVVSTAQNRTYLKFEENQANFTARSSIEYFISGISGNTTIQAKSSGGVTFTDVVFPSKSDKVTIARDIEWEIRQLNSLDIDHVAGDKDDNDPLALYTDPAEPAAQVGTYHDGPLKITVTLPTASDSSDVYGKLADNGEAYLEISVLDRTFDVGSDGTPKTGNRAKDTMKIRIVSKATFGDCTSTVVAIYETDQNPPIWNNAMKSIQNTSIGGAKMAIIGGTSAQSPIAFQNNNDLYGSLFMTGDINLTTQTTAKLYANESVYVGGDAIIQNSGVPIFDAVAIDPATNTSYDPLTDRPTAYINGIWSVNNNGCTVGCTGSTYSSADPNKKVDIIVANNSGAVTAAVLAGGKYNGDIYIKGNLDLSGAQNPTDFSVNGKVYVDGNLTVHNNWYGNSSFITSIKDGLFVTGNITTVGGDAVAGATKPAAGSLNTTIDADGKVTLPLSSGTRIIPTLKSEYVDFYKFDTSGTALVGTYLTAEEMAYTNQSNLKKGVYLDKPFTAPKTLSPGNISTMGLEAGGEFIITPGTYTGSVTIPDGKSVKIVAEQGYYTWQASIFNSSTAAAVSSTSPLMLGDDNPAFKPSKGSMVYIYIKGASTWDMDLIGSSRPLITGYIYAPQATLTGDDKGQKLYFRYDGSPLDSKDMAFVGSVVFKTINFIDVPAVAYIPSDPLPTAGSPSITMKLKYYTRNEESKGE